MSKLSIQILKELKPCEEGLEFFKESFGDHEYTVSELLTLCKDKKLEIKSENINWLIINYEFCQTPEMIEYYKSLNPSYRDRSWLIQNCEYCQTEEMIKYYKSLNPNFRNVAYLIIACKFCQTQEMIKYYKSLNPSYTDRSWLIKNCEYCQKPEIREILVKGLE